MEKLIDDFRITGRCQVCRQIRRLNRMDLCRDCAKTYDKLREE